MNESERTEKERIDWLKAHPKPINHVAKNCEMVLAGPDYTICKWCQTRGELGTVRVCSAHSHRLLLAAHDAGRKVGEIGLVGARLEFGTIEPGCCGQASEPQKVVRDQPLPGGGPAPRR